MEGIINLCGMSDETSAKRIAIIGGTGEFGRLFAHIFKEEGHEVTITGRDREKGMRVARAAGVTYTDDNKAAASDSDIVIISVSIENTVAVIEEVAPLLKKGSLIMDFTSVKTRPVEAMEANAPEDTDVIGAHPMFGPRVGSLEGQTVILTPVRAEKWMGFVEDFFKRQKARLYISTPEEHDRAMAIVQGLTHFAYLTTASTIRDMGVDVDTSRRFASPIYELMLDFIARIVGQNPHLYASIQMHNPYVPEVHGTFIRQAQKIKRIVEEGDIEGFVKTMTSSARIFKDVEGSMGKSDKAISALTLELKRLKKAVGKEVGLRQIYSQTVHVGEVHSVDPDIVEIGHKGKKVKLKLSKIELLDEKELAEWKKEHMRAVKQDFSYTFPEKVDESVLAKILTDSDPAVNSCEVIDVFRGRQIPEGKKSITLRVEVIGAGGFQKIEKLLKGLGGELR